MFQIPAEEMAKTIVGMVVIGLCHASGNRDRLQFKDNATAIQPWLVRDFGIQGPSK